MSNDFVAYMRQVWSMVETERRGNDIKRRLFQAIADLREASTVRALSRHLADALLHSQADLLDQLSIRDQGIAQLTSLLETFAEQSGERFNRVDERFTEVFGELEAASRERSYVVEAVGQLKTELAASIEDRRSIRNELRLLREQQEQQDRRLSATEQTIARIRQHLGLNDE